MTIELSHLKKMTDDAIRKGKAEAARSDEEKAARKAAENAAVMAQALDIIGSIPSKCQAAAEVKKNEALIMKEDNFCFHKSEFVKGKWTAEITGGPGAIVLDACHRAGIPVSVRYQHDGCGMKSWAEMYVSWD